MRYRIHGRDEASQSPVEPFFLDAANEEEARSRALELGTIAERVEAVGPEAEAIQAFPPSLMAKLRVEKRPVAKSRTGWLVVGLVLVPLSVAAGIGIGFMVPRATQPAAGAPAAAAAAAASTNGPLAGIRIEHLTAAEDLFNMAGQRAVVLKYSGGDVDCWVEIDSNRGKQKMEGWRMGFGAGDSDLKQPGPDQTVEGYFVWARGDDNGGGWPGSEQWRVAYKRGLATTKAAVVDVGDPAVHINFVQSLQESSGWSMGTGVQVWNGKPASVEGGIRTFTSTNGAIPTPFPVGQEVCVQEFREERKWQQLPKSLMPSVRDTASLVGVLASPQGLFPAACAFSSDEMSDVHTIRVMCRAANRYQAACLSLRAAAGKPEQDRAKIRAQALDWLRADLELAAKEFQTGGAYTVLALDRQLPRWQANPDLASIRDADAVAKLPEAERAGWQKLWTSVEDLHKEVRAAIITEAGYQGTLTEQDPPYVEPYWVGSGLNAGGKKTAFKAYELTMKAGRVYLIDMAAAKTPDNKLDPYLFLEDQAKPAGSNEKIVAQDDDSGGFPNARIRYRAAADGAYRIIATGLPNHKDIGAYTLTIRSVKDGK